MSEVEHTHEKWIVVDRDGPYLNIEPASGGSAMAFVYHEHPDAARLMSSAPDMAAEIARLKEINAELIHALEEVRGFMGDVCAPEYYWDLVNPAIAKAEQL